MDFSFNQLHFDQYGQPEPPSLVLERADDIKLGILMYAFNIEIELKYNELSTAKFDYPETVDGEVQSLYKELVVGRIVNIHPYGRFIISEIEENESDRNFVATVSLKSLEYELANKQLVIGEGTYKLYSPIDDGTSLLGIILEKILNWSIGSVDSTLWNIYRTFPQTEQGLLDFMYNVLQETYGCVVVFDTERRTINIIDAKENAPQLPIYLSSDTVIKEQNLTTTDANVANKISVYGADGIDIRDVNPTGTTEIINLGYALSKGDLHGDLAEKYIAWKNEIVSQQDYYTGIVALRNSTASRLLNAKAQLTDLQSELTKLENTQATTLQMLNIAKEEETIEYMEQRLREILSDMDAVKRSIKQQEELIDSIQTEYDQYTSDIIAVTERLKITKYFTKDEQKILDKLFIEGTYSDATFATFDVDITGEDDSYTSLSSSSIKFSDATVVDIKMPSSSSHRILDISGGRINIFGDIALEAELMHATLDVWDNQGVCSLFVGDGKISENNVKSANISMSIETNIDVNAILNRMERHENHIHDDETGVEYTTYYYTGDISLSQILGKAYITRNATEYQKYSVQKQLYDYASKMIEKMSYPTTEFEIDSANILYAQEFAFFRDKLALGRGIYLKINENLVLKPLLLEVHIDCFDATKFELIFSNQFQTKRTDAVSQLSEIIKNSSNASKSLDLSKYDFGKFESSGAFSALANFLQNGMDAAYQQVTAGENQTVTIDGGGIKIHAADSTEYIMMANGMIAIIDTEAQETKAAIGHFYNESTNTDFNGVLADVIGGILLAGKNMHMECYSPDGKITQFKFDGTGAFLNNSRLYLQSDAGGRIGLDPEHGFLAGMSSLFSVTGTGIIKPSCKDAEGRLILDDFGFPKNTNVYIGLDGKAYFRGDIYAENGYFNGEVHATTGSFTGEINATSGIFKGTVQADRFLDRLGNDMMTNGKWDSEYLDIRGLNVNNNFIIDEYGRVTINNGYISWGSVTGTEEIDQKIQDAADAADAAHQAANAASSDASNAQDIANNAQRDADLAKNLASDASDEAVEAAKNIKKLANGTFTGYTFIDGKNIMSPYITGGTITGIDIYGGLYLNLDGSYSLEIGDYDGYNAFTFRRGRDVDLFDIFSVFDGDGGYVGIAGKRYEFLNIESGRNISRPQGTWDFTDSTVIGVSATFG